MFYNLDSLKTAKDFQNFFIKAIKMITLTN